jgi:hypothetical protein
LTDAYNQAVLDASKTVYWKFAFTVFAMGLSLAAVGFHPSPAADASAVLSIVRFAALDKKPIVQAGSAAPVAMFHDVESRLGVTLKNK